jgi:hypothetical protein
MPKIQTKVAESMPDLSEGGEYQIKTAEAVDTQQNHWKGIRLGVTDSENIEYAAMLWFPKDMEKGTADYSKLGAFVSVFGDDTDNWISKYFRVESWKSKNNEIREIDTFSSEPRQKKTPKGGK